MNDVLRECMILGQTVRLGRLKLHALKLCFIWQQTLVRISYF